MAGHCALDEPIRDVIPNGNNCISRQIDILCKGEVILSFLSLCSIFLLDSRYENVACAWYCLGANCF